MDKRDQLNNPAIKKGYYGRYGRSRTHRLAYKDSNFALKRRERHRANKIIQDGLVEYVASSSQTD